MANFPIWNPDCDSYNPALLVLLLSSDQVFVLHFFKNFDYAIFLVSIDFPSDSKGYTPVDWNGLQHHLKGYHRYKLITSQNV